MIPVFGGNEEQGRDNPPSAPFSKASSAEKPLIRRPR